MITNKRPKENEKEEEINKRVSKNYVPETKDKNNSFEGTLAVENKKIGML